MKNKHWIGWGIYYAAAVLACTICALALPEAIQISFLSLLPLCLAVIPLTVFSKWYVTHGFGTRTPSNPTFDIKYQKIKGRGGDIILEDNRSDQKHPFEVDDAAKQRAALALTPLYFPFLVFFSLGKLFALLLLPLEIIAIFSYASLVMQKEVKKHMEEEKRRLKEQETREELGMWR
ncbi:MAG: hypothetical protein IJZ80_06050 [Clostridia bacterium]|nr:hypothetical protein [Clostridia bacterium]